MSLTYIGQQCTIFGGFSLLFSGIIGNGVNMFIFLSTNTYRTTPSSFCFLIGSICKQLYILISLTTRILAAGYGIDFTRTSLIWCKMRQYFISTFTLICLTCSSLAIIDQFLVTSQNPALRRCSKIKWAHRIILAMIIVWSLHGIPFFLYFTISLVTTTCVNINTTFRDYLVTYTIVTLCIIPVVIQIIFGYLTYRNIRHTVVLAQLHADRQLTIMTLIQVVLIIVSISPLGIFVAYNWITSTIVKDTDRQIKEGFASTIIGLTSYLYYVGDFYMFLISSSRFRETVKERLFWWYRTNQIEPSHTQP